MSTIRIRNTSRIDLGQWDQDLPPAVLMYAASLPRAAAQVKLALAHWNTWLQLLHLGSLESAKGYCYWERFLTDHAVIYETGERSDYGLYEYVEETLCKKQLKSRGPLSFNEVKRRISILVQWQAHNQWNEKKDLRALSRLYQRFRAISQQPAQQITDLSGSDACVSNMLRACQCTFQGSRDQALIALSQLLDCPLDDLAQMKCSDIQTDDWHVWSVRLPSQPSAAPMLLDLNTACKVVGWLFERAWRPGLEEKLFQLDNRTGPLTPPHIRLIFERRYRISQVLTKSYSDREPDMIADRSLLYAKLSDTHLDELLSRQVKQLVSSIELAKKHEDCIRRAVERHIEERKRQAEREAKPLQHKARRKVERLREPDAWGPQSIERISCKAKINKRDTGWRNTDQATGLQMPVCGQNASSNPPTPDVKCNRDEATVSVHDGDWDAAIRQMHWHEHVYNQQEIGSHQKEPDDEQVSWEDTILGKYES
ncbi:hypothetical protein D3C78_596390 [compost metagenome]